MFTKYMHLDSVRGNLFANCVFYLHVYAHIERDEREMRERSLAYFISRLTIDNIYRAY